MGMEINARTLGATGVGGVAGLAASSVITTSLIDSARLPPSKERAIVWTMLALGVAAGGLLGGSMAQPDKGSLANNRIALGALGGVAGVTTGIAAGVLGTLPFVTSGNHLGRLVKGGVAGGVLLGVAGIALAPKLATH